MRTAKPSHGFLSPLQGLLMHFALSSNWIKCINRRWQRKETQGSLSLGCAAPPAGEARSPTAAFGKRWSPMGSYALAPSHSPMDEGHM